MKRRQPRAKDVRPQPASHPQVAPPVLVQIEKPIYGGAFLARVDGKAIFTPLTLPGETARVNVYEAHRGWAKAELENLVAIAPERVEPACPYFGSCGGCHYQHASYEAQLSIKQAVLRETLVRAGVTPSADMTVLAGHPWAYRNRIRLAFDSGGNIGYRSRRSHSIVPIRECSIAAPLLIKAALTAAEYFRRSTRSQRPTEITLFCDAAESVILATVLVANPARSRADDFVHLLTGEIPQFAGAVFTTQGLPGRQVHSSAISGAGSLRYRAAGFFYRVDNGAFFQVNRWLIEPLIERVTAGRSGALAWDLFAGVGLFARQLPERFSQVVAVESAPSALPPLTANLAGTAARAIEATALDFLIQHRNSARPDLVIVDPPRTGLGADVTRLLGEIAPDSLVYVSCDPATLARDLCALLGAGYEIEHITLADLFPQTFHIESVVELRRT